MIEVCVVLEDAGCRLAASGLGLDGQYLEVGYELPMVLAQLPPLVHDVIGAGEGTIELVGQGAVDTWTFIAAEDRSIVSRSECGPLVEAVRLSAFVVALDTLVTQFVSASDAAGFRTELPPLDAWRRSWLAALAVARSLEDPGHQ